MGKKQKVEAAEEAEEEVEDLGEMHIKIISAVNDLCSAAFQLGRGGA